MCLLILTKFNFNYGKCNYSKCNYGKSIYGKIIMANETEPFCVIE